MIHLVQNGTGFDMNIKVEVVSIHCHGTAKLNNDPGLCELTQTALKAFLAQKLKMRMIAVTQLN